METLDIRELEELACDYTEKHCRVVFVLGALDEAAMQVFLDMQNQAPVAIEPGPVPGGSGVSRRSICVSTRAQMIPELVRALWLLRARPMAARASTVRGMSVVCHKEDTGPGTGYW